MFERTLQDLIRGLRAHKASSKGQEDAFLAEAMVELREELKGKDMALKGEGVLKMCYLMMLYPIPPPPGFAFHVVEVMSSSRYHLKQLGYLAAPMAFSGETEEVVLTVNGIKKDLMSPHLPLPPLPLTALPHLLALSPSLSHTLHPDLLHLLTHSTPRIRKRAVLCLLPCWEAFPEGLREGFSRLRDRLLDNDQGVVGATVSVVMELARRQGGKNYLPLAPELFAILTGSSNNWMLIKVVKLFAILTPLEPRLVRKLLPPITSLISSTSAISLLYECVRTCIVGGMLDPDRPEGEALARVCVEKLGGYLRDEGGDQNLRYIALLAMVKIIPTHPQMIAEYQDEVLQSLDDTDVSIRMRSLELVTSMVERSNIQSIVDQLLAHLAPPTSTTAALPSATASLLAASGRVSPSLENDNSASATLSLTPAYRLLLAQRLLAIIANDTYVNVIDFEWVVSILVDVSYVSNVDVGAEVRDMLLDVVARVKSVRPYAARTLERVIADDGLRDRINDRTCVDGLLEAAVWICGEYPDGLASPLSAISSILALTLTTSPPSLIAYSLEATAKVFAHHLATISTAWSADLHQQAKDLVVSVKNGFGPFTKHAEIEVQERAVELLQLFSFVEADLASHVPRKLTRDERRSLSISSMASMESGFSGGQGSIEPYYPKSLFLFQPLFTRYELNALGVNAQESVRIPDGLDLNSEIMAANGFDDFDFGGDESDAELGKVDLGDGGGASMAELRRVMKEQEVNDKGKPKKIKGKGKKAEGEITTVEEQAEREKRKAAKRAKAKEDPYYLYDEKEDQADDVDGIPIVRLDDTELTDGADTVPRPKPKKTRSKGQSAQTTVAPPEFDRTGEMPKDPSPGPPSHIELPKTGLASIDLLDTPRISSRRSSSSRFEEYREDEAEDRRGGSVLQAGTPPIPTPEVEVVRVKRKKKKAKDAV